MSYPGLTGDLPPAVDHRDPLEGCLRGPESDPKGLLFRRNPRLAWSATPVSAGGRPAYGGYQLGGSFGVLVLFLRRWTPWGPCSYRCSASRGVQRVDAPSDPS